MQFLYGNLGLAVLNLLICLLMASLAPRGLVFGVRLPIDQLRSPEIRSIKRKYRLSCFYLFLVCVGATLLPLLRFSRLAAGELVVMMLMLLALPAVILLPFAFAYKATLALKTNRGWETPPADPVTLDAGLNPANRIQKVPGFLPMLSLIAIVPTFLLLFLYNALNTVPYLMAPGAEMLIALTALLVHRSLAQMSIRNIHPEEEVNAFLHKQKIRMWSTFSAYVFFMVSALVTAMVYLGLSGHLERLFWLVPAACLMILLPAAILSRSAHGKRLSSFLRASDEPIVIDRGHDRHWRFGLLYCNANDPAVFVDARCGMSREINFGHRKGKILLTGLVVVYLLLLAFGLHFGLVRA